MYQCPDDPTHQSTSHDVCSICGALIIDVPPPAAKAAPGWPTAAPARPSPAAAAPRPSPGSSTSCGNCGVHHEPNALFCENCGFDFATGTLDVADAPAPAVPMPAPVPAAAPPPPSADSAPPTVSIPAPSKASLDALVTVETGGSRERPDDAVAPADQSQRIFLLEGDRLLIGRGSASVHPQIVLKDDSGISRGHAELLRNGDGSYSVRDLDSANGTSVNDKPLSGTELVALKPGDQIQIGFWHTITIRKR